MATARSELPRHDAEEKGTYCLGPCKQQLLTLSCSQVAVIKTSCQGIVYGKPVNQGINKWKAPHTLNFPAASPVFVRPV